MSSDNNLFTDFPPVSRQEWEEVIKKDLRGADYKNKLNWQTGEGIEALPFYRQDDFDSLPTPLAASAGWEVRHQIDEQEISKANKIARTTLERGVDAPTFILHIEPTGGSLGRDLHGTAIQHQQAFNQLMQDIDLSEHAVHFDTGPASPVVIAMLHNYCEAEDVDPANISGSVLDDPYAFAITHGYFPTGEETRILQKQQIVKFCANNLPNLKSLGIDARVYHNGGSTIVQEVGYALAAASEHLATQSESGLDTTTIASNIHFNFSVGSNYFLEIAKFRALRKLWQTVLRAYEAGEQPAYIHAVSSGWNKTVYDPYVNMLRTTTEGMSAALAGCDAITLQPFDESFRQPNDFSRRIARNSQTILKEEAYIDKVSDPAAGSYYIEKLTDKIAEAAWNCFREVEQQGGLFQAINDGYIQTAIEKSQNKRDLAIATRQRIFVGINKYPNPGDHKPRNETATAAASVKETDTEYSLDPEQLIPSIKKALQNGAALGDLITELTEPANVHLQTIRPYRGPKAFEELRQATEEHSKTPTVLTLPIGNKKIRKARSAFTANFFGCAGYQIEDPIGFDEIDDAIEAIQSQQPDIAVLCSADEEYPELIPALCNQLKDMDNKPSVVVAGYPKEHIESYRELGVHTFIHTKCNVLETLREFQQRLGIIKNDE